MNAENQSLLYKVLLLNSRLNDLYGENIPRPTDEPVAALVNTILSQNTNDHNRDIAYKQLRSAFPTWEEVRDAPEDKLVEVIRPAGLAPSKAPRIQAALKQITAEKGEISLDFLYELPLEDARTWLTNLHGVGPKTAAIVLLFALGRPAFPVDTHIHRVTKRWGLITEKTSREKAHAFLEDLIPRHLYYSFHINIIQHGRSVCAARNPRCELCILQDLCMYYQVKYKGE